VFGITPSSRLRPSPYFEATLAEGVTAFTTYNRMLMPTSYGNPEEQYWRLLRGVAQWDVGCERQVELKGPDAGHLAQILSPRDLSGCAVGQGKYVWHRIARQGRTVGSLTNCTWSYRLGSNIGFALVSIDCAAGDAVEVFKDGRTLAGTLTQLPFI
jgi:glycine cleavage system aminomethyltransferase T